MLLCRVAKLWAEEGGILKGRGRMAPYLVELLMVRAMENVIKDKTSSIERSQQWNINDCPLIWRSFLELLAEEPQVRGMA